MTRSERIEHCRHWAKVDPNIRWLLSELQAAEGVIEAARSCDRLLFAQATFDCPHYEPPCDCVRRERALDAKVDTAIAEYRRALAEFDKRGGR